MHVNVVFCTMSSQSWVLSMVTCLRTVHCPECRRVGIWAKHPNVKCHSSMFLCTLVRRPTQDLIPVQHYPSKTHNICLNLDISERLKIGGRRWLGLLGVVMWCAFQVLQWRRWSSGNGHHRRSLAFIDPAQLVCEQSSTTGFAQPVLLSISKPLLYMQKCFRSKLVKGKTQLAKSTISSRVCLEWGLACLMPLGFLSICMWVTWHQLAGGIGAGLLEPKTFCPFHAVFQEDMNCFALYSYTSSSISSENTGSGQTFIISETSSGEQELNLYNKQPLKKNSATDISWAGCKVASLVPLVLLKV